ncbi:hypothetical protein BG011_002399 [Mortierella polycephala]|uniref:DASH complex subunit DAD4 n=1 Tax=Mortierella polycephala TaxID=41804 RepID=A0A9P6Q3B6_9FUNG|nr:hypothetical protein BG011_002399 [Mortierella polycephala]
MDPYQEQQAALLNRIAQNVEKLNESLEQLNEKLARVNEMNQTTTVIAQVWSVYCKSGLFMLEDPTSAADLGLKGGSILVINVPEEPTSPINSTSLPPEKKADPNGGIDNTVPVPPNSEFTIPVPATTNTEETFSEVPTSTPNMTPPAPESKGMIFARYATEGVGILTVIGVGGVVGGTAGLVVGLITQGDLGCKTGSKADQRPFSCVQTLLLRDAGLRRSDKVIQTLQQEPFLVPYSDRNNVSRAKKNPASSYRFYQTGTHSESHSDLNPPMEFIVGLGLDYEQWPGPRPVMGMQVERALHYGIMECRRHADLRARDLLRFMRMSVQHPLFYVVSVIGTRCCIYTCETATRRVVPECIRPTDLSVDQDLAPSARWSIGIATLEGRRELSSHFDAMKAACKIEAKINS